MNLPPIVALEIGTSKVRAIVGEAREDGCIMVTGLGECESRGVRKGEIVDFDNALSCVRTALHAAEENGRVVINEVHMALSGGHIKSLINRGSVPIMDPNGEIMDSDIEHVMETARAVNLPADREILHTICQHFYVDDQEGVLNPEGMEGSKLALDMLILHGVRTRLRNIVRIVRSVKLDVADVAFGGLCAGLAVLSPEDKESGVAVIDLGGGTTDFLVYAHNAIASAGSIAVGGDHVTNDIARGLRIPSAEAERLKCSIGSATQDISNRGQTTSLSTGMGLPERSVRISDLNTIIHLRMEETFSLLRNQWMEENLLPSIGGGIVLTGGGAFLKNAARLAEKVFSLPCQLGTPRNVSGLAVATEGPEYATVVGMLRYGFKTAGRETQGVSLRGLLRKIFGK